LLDFEFSAIRCRRAGQVSGGPGNAQGFFVGKTFRAATLGHGWADGILIGVDPADKHATHAGYAERLRLALVFVQQQKKKQAAPKLNVSVRSGTTRPREAVSSRASSATRTA
jgi:hypothetical protein